MTFLKSNQSDAFLFVFFSLSFQQSQLQEIERNRSSMEQQKSVERIAIDKKLKTAAEMRDENIKKMLERLKEHVRHKITTVNLLANAFYLNFETNYVIFELFSNFLRFSFFCNISAKSDQMYPYTRTQTNTHTYKNQYLIPTTHSWTNSIYVEQIGVSG